MARRHPIAACGHRRAPRCTGSIGPKAWNVRSRHAASPLSVVIARSRSGVRRDRTAHHYARPPSRGDRRQPSDLPSTWPAAALGPRPVRSSPYPRSPVAGLGRCGRRSSRPCRSRRLPRRAGRSQRHVGLVEAAVASMARAAGLAASAAKNDLVRSRGRATFPRDHRRARPTICCITSSPGSASVVAMAVSGFDVVIIGAGHAGCEAAWAAAPGCHVSDSARSRLRPWR